jgi:hypothetical protein
MKVSGFTFVKDAVKFDFPVVESLRSMLPLCDELIVNVGVSEDNTLELVKSIGDDKIQIIETKWDEQFRARSRILAQQTNIPLYKCTGDWCLYLQADEVLHEEDYDRILGAMKDNLDDDRVEGLLFDWRHFFGSYKTYVDSYHWYRREIRIVRNHLGITSWRDAQGFRVDGKKLNVKETGAHIYHYGWVRDPYKMGNKKKYHDAIHHGDKKIDFKEDRFYYEEHIDPYLVSEFQDTHPLIMKDRIDNWKFEFEPDKFNYKTSSKDIRKRMTDKIDKITSWKIGEYKNYKLIK